MTATPTTKTPLQRLIPLLMLMAMVGPLTLNILQASMQSVLRTFATTRDNVQLTLSLYILGMAVAQLIGGPMADRFGRRPVILGGLVLYIAASIAAMLAPGIGWLIGARLLQALGATVCLSLSRTIVSDLADRATATRVIAYVAMIMVVAPVAAPNIGAALDALFGWRSVFAFCTLFGAVVAVAVSRVLFETRPASLQHASYGDVARRTWRLARNPAFLRYVALSSFASACFFIFIGAAPHLIIDDFGLTAQEFGLWYLILGVGYAAGNFTVSRKTTLAPERIMQIGNLALLVGCVIIIALALVPVRHPAAVFLPAMLFTFGNGLVLPHSMASAIQTDREAGGAASGLLGFAQMFVGAVASYLVSHLPGAGALPMAIMMLLCGLVALSATPRVARRGPG